MFALYLTFAKNNFFYYSMTHPLLIAGGINKVLRFKNKTLANMIKRKGKGLIHQGYGRKIGAGFKKDPEPDPAMHPAVMPRRALKFR